MNRWQIPFKSISIIWWQDAHTTLDDIPKFLDGKSHLTISVGVIVEEDKEFVYISHFYDGIQNKMDSPYTVIPKGMIKHRERINVRRKRN